MPKIKAYKYLSKKIKSLKIDSRKPVLGLIFYIYE
jgi:hypothetical protein